MSFLSGLKSAYDSIGSEITKTFDSTSENPPQSTLSTPATAQQRPESPPTGPDESSLYVTPKGGGVSNRPKDDGFGSNWGEWEAQSSQRRTKNSPSKSNSQTIPPPVQPSDSPDGGSVTTAIKGVASPPTTSTPTGVRLQGGGSVPIATSTPARPQGKSQLDSLSRDDLIKYIKKQGILLQKSKTKCDELAKECEQLKERAGGASEHVSSQEGVAWEELQVVRGERDQAVSQAKDLRQTVTGLSREKQDISDQFEALQESHSKLKQFVQEQQQQLDKRDAERPAPTSGEGSIEQQKDSEELSSLREKLEKSGLEYSLKVEQLEKEKQDLSSKYAELLKKARKLQVEMKGMKEKLVLQDSLRDRVRTLEEENKDLTSNVTNLNTELESAEQRVAAGTEGQKGADEVRRRCEQLERDLAGKVEVEEALQEEVKDVRAKCTELEGGLADGAEREKALTKEVGEVRAKCTELEGGLADGAEREGILAKELEFARSKCTQLEHDVANKCADEAFKDTLNKKCAQLEQTLTAEEDRNNTLHETNQQLQKSCAVYKLQISKLQSECQDLARQLGGASDGKAELAAVTSELAEVKVHMESAASDAEQERTVLAGKLARAECGMKEAESELAKALGELEEGKKKNCELEQAVTSVKESLDCELRQAVARGSDLETRLQDMESRWAGLERDYDEKAALLEAADTKLATLRANVESRQHERDSEAEGVFKEIASLQQALEETRRENAALQENLESSQHERDSEAEGVSKEIASLQQSLEEARRENAALQENLESSQHERDSEAEGVSKEIASLQQALKEARKENAGMKKTMERAEENEGQREQTEKAELLSSHEQNQQLLEECERLKKDLGEQRSTVEGVVKEREDLKEEAVVLRRELEALRVTVGKEATAHKEENKKLKAFAIKMKKELSETRERESSLAQQLQAGQETGEAGAKELEMRLQAVAEEKTKKLQAVKEEKTKLEEKLQAVKEEKTKLEEKLKAVKEEKTKLEEVQRNEVSSLKTKQEERLTLIAQLTAESEGLRRKLTEAVDSKDVIASEVASLQSDLATVQSEKNTQQMAIEAAQSEVRRGREELEREVSAHKETRQRLGLLEKEAKSSNLMSMELEDYQRSIQSLEAELKGKDQTLEQVQKEGQLQQEVLQNMRRDSELLTQQRSQSDETVMKLKQLLMKNKKELSEGKRREEELQTTVSALQGLLEEEKQGSEQAKVEVSQVMAKIQSMKQKSELSVESLQQTNRNLEHRLSLVQTELTSTQAALATTRSDYDSYKVRVHSVLKQKATGPGQAEIDNEMKQKYEREVVKLSAELQQAKTKLVTSLSDHDDLLVEHQQLASRHEELLLESEGRREGLERAWREETSRHSVQSQEQTELIIQLRNEIEKVTTAFTTQLQGLQEEHNKVVCSLKEELKLVQSECSRLQQEADNRVLAKPISMTANGVLEGIRPHTMEVPRPPNELRSSGEGMEQSELESIASTPLSVDGTSLSFERLLSVGGGDLSSQDPKLKLDDRKLHKQLKLAHTKINHMSELLRESEASSLRLGDQAKLLKEEIRRLERNQDREKGVSNMEYLKNIVLKFLHNEGDEKKALIPIIEKLLLLSPQEVKYLSDTLVRGKASALPGAELNEDTNSSKNSSWSGYVHRWTGY